MSRRAAAPLRPKKATAAPPKLGLTSFEFGPILSRGQIATVYKATSKKTNKVFAIKQIHKEFRACDTEAKVSTKWLCKVKHANIVNWTKYFMANASLHLVAPFQDLGSLSDVMQLLKRPLTEQETAAILKSVVAGLAAAHEHGICHGDLKAANVLLTNAGVVKVGDFLIRNWIKPVNVWWHAHWMAPEVMEIGFRDGGEKQADIWSLGALAIELLEGKPALHEFGDTVVKMQIRRGTYPTAPPKSSKEFKAFIWKVIVAEPEMRPSAEDLLNDPFLAQISADEARAVTTALAKACAPLPRKKISEFEYEEEEEDTNEEEEEQAEEEAPENTVA